MLEKQASYADFFKRLLEAIKKLLRSNKTSLSTSKPVPENKNLSNLDTPEVDIPEVPPARYPIDADNHANYIRELLTRSIKGEKGAFKELMEATKLPSKQLANRLGILTLDDISGYHKDYHENKILLSTLYQLQSLVPYLRLTYEGVTSKDSDNPFMRRYKYTPFPNLSVKDLLDKYPLAERATTPEQRLRLLYEFAVKPYEGKEGSTNFHSYIAKGDQFTVNFIGRIIPQLMAYLVRFN
ncbi:MAG: hypothetical protein QW303_02585 [Nitrososphaerota archaeon]